jgi:hypothetical protein
MKSPYVGREQTATKHFILKSYLQTLTYKLFSGVTLRLLTSMDFLVHGRQKPRASRTHPL